MSCFHVSLLMMADTFEPAEFKRIARSWSIGSTSASESTDVVKAAARILPSSFIAMKPALWLPMTAEPIPGHQSIATDLEALAIVRSIKVLHQDTHTCYITIALQQSVGDLADLQLQVPLCQNHLCHMIRDRDPQFGNSSGACSCSHWLAADTVQERQLVSSAGHR